MKKAPCWQEPKKAPPHQLLGSVELTVPGRTFLSVPRQDSFMLLYCRSGAGELIAGEGRRAVVAGNLLLLHFGATFSLQSAGGGVSLLALLFQGSGEGVPVACNIRPGSNIEWLLEQAAKEISSEEGPLGTASPVLEEFFDVLRGGNSDKAHLIPRYLEKLKEILDTRYAEPLSLDRFAEEIHLNKYKLVKDFKACFGVPPIEYLIGRRIREACRLLLETQDGIAVIGASVGMENTPYFLRTFKRKVGSTPSAFRSYMRELEGKEAKK